MSVAVKDLACIAGLAEGEGCFREQKKPRWSPHFVVVMTDKDVLIKLAGLLNTHVTGPYQYKVDRKPFYRVEISGRRAIAWMLTLFTFMCKRRRLKIKTLVKSFLKHKNHRRAYHKYYNRGEVQCL